MYTPLSTPDPLADEELIRHLRERLGLPSANVEVRNERPFLSRLLGSVKGRFGQFIVYGVLAWSGRAIDVTKYITDIVLVPQKIEEAYQYYAPKGHAATNLVRDYVARIERHEVNPGSLPPSNNYIVFGQHDAILPPDQPKLTTPTPISTPTTPPPSSSGALAGTAYIRFGAQGTLAGPTIVSSSGLPLGSLQLMERVDSPVRELPVWEL